METETPEVGKRMIPLLDLIFLLLIFFIILPHGSYSRKLLQIDQLKQEKKEIQAESREMNRELKKELDTFREQYGSQAPSRGGNGSLLVITLENDALYIGKNPDKKNPIRGLKKMKEKLKNIIIARECKVVWINESPNGPSVKFIENLKSYIENVGEKSHVRCWYGPID